MSHNLESKPLEKLYTRVKDLAGIARSDWVGNVNEPFFQGAYAAEESMKRVYDLQKETDKKNAEMLAAVLGVFGGTGLTALFAHATLKATLSDAMLHGIVKYNMERTYRAYHFVETNKAASFLVGGLADIGESKLTGALKSTISQRGSEMTYATQAFRDAKSLKESLDAYAERGCSKIKKIVLALEDDRDMPDDTKRAALIALTKSGYFRPPSRSMDPLLGKKIELARWMRKVLDSDYKVRGSTSQRLGGIDVLPDDPKYPKGGRSRGSTRVMFQQFGSAIEAHVNKLFKEVMNADVDFFQNESWNPLMPTNSRQELLRAATVLDTIGHSAKVESIPKPPSLRAILATLPPVSG